MWVIIGIIVFILILVIIIVAIANSSNGGEYRNHNNSSNTYEPRILPKQDEWDKYQQERFGQLGEEYVADMLQDIVDDNKAYLFNDYTFIDENGYSTNIDHILVCVGGIFIIETKSNKGIIYGDDDSEYWHAEKEAWQEDKEFKNPVKQNQGHINHLRRMFKNNPPKMYSLIIFPAVDSIDNVNSKFAYDVDSAHDFIYEKINESNYSEQFVNRIYNDLKDIIDTYGISIEEHKRNLRNKH